MIYIITLHTPVSENDNRRNIMETKFPILTFQNYLTLADAIILLCAGDIARNPGPNIHSRDLSVCHLNVQSLLSKVDLVAIELSKFDVITVSETWLDSTISTSDILIPNYQDPIRLDRNRHGGGVAMYFKKCIPYTERQDLYLPGLEAIWAEILLSNKKVLIGTFYLHPRFDNWNMVQVSIEQALLQSPNVILLGDFNQNMLDTSKCHDILDILNTFNLNQHIDSPTRVTAHSQSIIDLVITSDTLSCSSKGTLDPFCSDHHTIYFSTSFMKIKQHTYKRKIWLYENGNYDDYRHQLEQCIWPENDQTVEQQVECITNNILQSADLSIPNKTVTIRPLDPPWFHNEIRLQIRARNRIHKKAKRTNNPNDWANFRTSRNNVINLIRNSKINYFKKLSDSLSHDNLTSRQWWKVTKQFLNDQKSSDIPFLIENNIQLNSPKDKAEILNNFFCKQSDIDDSNAALPPDRPSLSSFTDINITTQDVSDAIKLICPNKASGPDFINPRLIKEGKDILSPHLSRLFNKSLQQSSFPDTWKTANVIPVYKKGEKSDPSNYRPISLLSCLSKVFERCVFKHFYNYINSNSLITAVQSGFTPNDSAVFQLIDLYNCFSRAIDDGKEVRVVFCDISKAFDRVWHTGLLYKLRSIGVGGTALAWFHSYLEDRVQRVALEGDLSTYKQVKAGVPQGSILGPLLFLIYINDIVEDIGSYIRLFADDTSLYIIVENPNVGADILNMDLEKIHQWSNTWLVKFNPNKTEELLISRKRTPPHHPPLTMNNIPIKTVTTHKHLGLTFNKTCTWSDHIQDITGKAWKRVNLLRKLKFDLTRKTLLIIYTSFIRPLLEYGDTVWDNCSIGEANEIEKVQIEACRIITGATKSCSKIKVLAEAGLESLQSRRYKHRLITFYKMVNHLTPPYLHLLVPPSNFQASQRNLRSRDNIQIPTFHTNLYSNSFLPNTIREWNTLPEHIKNLPSLSSFKHYLNRDIHRVPQYYYHGDRKLQILHTRLRLGCSSLNADLYTNHISLDNTCTCGEIENAQHYLLHCHVYREIRRNTIAKLTVPITIDILLNGCPLYDDNVNSNIFQVVQEFIKDSKRF